MQQKPIDILHVLTLAVRLIADNHSELLKAHPLEQLYEVVESSSMFPELKERLENYTIVETMDLLQDLLLTCLKQSETYH